MTNAATPHSGNDPVLVMGDIITMNPNQPRAAAMAVVDGSVLGVGDPASLRSRLPEGAQVLDYGQRVILPGFIDCHHHLLWTGMSAIRVDLGAAAAIPELLDRVRQWAVDHPERAWIVSAEGWEIADLAEQRYPTREELDRVCPDRPVYLPRGGHVAVANSAAFALAGIGDDTPDPAGGEIERDSTGRATGLLLEHARDLVGQLVPPPSQAERVEALAAAQQRCLAQGITRIVDPGLTPDEIAAYRAAVDSGQFRMRATLLGLVSSSASARDEAEAFLPMMRDSVWTDQLRLGGLKVFLDGGGSLGTAWLHKEYPGRPGYHGEMLMEQADLDALVDFAFNHRIPVGVHTVGDAAIDSALASISRLGPPETVRDAGFSLIHAYLWPSPTARAMARDLGVSVAAQPGMYARFAAILIDRFGLDATLDASPLRSWLADGVTLGGGSDSPVTSSTPLHGMWHAVTRWHEGRTLNADECLSREQALEMYAGGAARVALVDGHEGVLREGARADWVVLDGNPLTCPVHDLPNLVVVATAVGGRTVHQTD